VFLRLLLKNDYMFLERYTFSRTWAFEGRIITFGGKRR
jgi:hypothetical protein